MRPQLDGDPRNPPRFSRAGGSSRCRREPLRQASRTLDLRRRAAPARPASIPPIRASARTRTARRQNRRAPRKVRRDDQPPTALAARASATQPPHRSGDRRSGGAIATSRRRRRASRKTRIRTRTRRCSQNLNQALTQNQTQQPRASPSTDHGLPDTAARRRGSGAGAPAHAVPEVDPFAPTGIQVGAFMLRPAHRGDRRPTTPTRRAPRSARRPGTRSSRRSCWSIRTGRATN